MQTAALNQSVRAPRAQLARRTRTVARVSCQQSNDAHPLSIVVGVAAASLLTASAANAGVILEQPKLKQTFVSDAAPAAPVEKKPLSFAPPTPKDASEAPKLEAPKFEVPSSGGIDPRAVALPGAIVGLAAGGFLLSKVDASFYQLANDKGWAVKDSIDGGAGYEEVLKSGDGFKGAVGKGTKAIKSKTAGKTGGFFGR